MGIRPSNRAQGAVSTLWCQKNGWGCRTETWYGYIDHHAGTAAQRTVWYRHASKRLADTAFNVSGAVDQVKKADEGWKDLRPGLRIIDKIVVVTGAAIPDDEQRERDGVTILAPRDLQELLRRMAVATAAARDE